MRRRGDTLWPMRTPGAGSGRSAGEADRAGGAPGTPAVARTARLRRRVRRHHAIVAGGLGAVVAASACLLLGARLLETAPSWWAPPSPDDPDVLESARGVENALATTVHRIRELRPRGTGHASAPWTVRITTEQACAWLATRLPQWLTNRVRDFAWPDNLGPVQVFFLEDEIVFGVETGGRVVSVHVRPRLDEHGRLLAPASHAAVGRFPLPARWLLSWADPDGRILTPSLAREPRVISVVRALAGEQPLLDEPVVTLDDGRQVRLLALDVAPGVLDLTCQTESPSHSP